MTTRACAAIQFSDQKYCRRCGLTWDMNDPEPPDCRWRSWSEFVESILKEIEEVNHVL